MNSKNDFEITINKKKVYVEVTDDNNKTISLPLIYPIVENSVSFWECAQVISEMYSKVNAEKVKLENVQSIDTETASKMISISGKLIPSLTNYICDNLNYLNEIKVSADQKENLYLLIHRNLEKVLLKFVEVFNELLPKGDAEKKKEEAVSTTE